MPQAAQVVLDQIQILSSPPTNGRSFLVADVYGLQVHSTDGELWKQQIFDGLSQFHANNGLNVAFIDFSRIWDAVLNPQVPPGFKAFGFTSTDPCCAVSQCTVSGECADPDHAFYWLVKYVPILSTRLSLNSFLMQPSLQGDSSHHGRLR